MDEPSLRDVLNESSLERLAETTETHFCSNSNSIEELTEFLGDTFAIIEEFGYQYSDILMAEAKHAFKKSSQGSTEQQEVWLQLAYYHAMASESSKKVETENDPAQKRLARIELESFMQVIVDIAQSAKSKGIDLYSETIRSTQQ